MSEYRERLAENISKARSIKGLSQTELAKSVDVSAQTISQYEKGKRSPDIDKLYLIADALDTSVAELIMGESDNNELKKANMKSLVQIPILGTVRAGFNLLADENVIGFAYAPKSDIGDGDYFYLNMEGDSMIDSGLNNGDRILVRKQNHVKDGSIAVVLINGEEATVKRVFFDNEKVILTPENARMRPEFLDEEDVRILGKVVSASRTYE